MRLKLSLGLLLIFNLFAFQAFSTTGITITASAPVSPIFKGIESNPLLYLRIYVPAGEKLSLRKLTLKANSAALQAVESVDVYFTGREASFNEKEHLAKLNPTRISESLAISLHLKPGVNYIWFSAKLKKDADIDSKIEFHVVQLEDVNSKKHQVREVGKGFVKRLGIAVVKGGQNDIHTFRIPGIATTDKGTLIAVYDIRYKNSRDLPANIDVGMNRSTDGGRTWEPMKVMMDMGEPHDNNGVGDPAVLFDPITKKIWVIALWSKGNRSIAGSKPGLSEDVTGQLVVVSSDDDGLTWSKPKSITAGVKDPEWNLFFNGPGSGIAMADGKIVFAAQYWDEHAMPHSTLVYSVDHGTTWKTEDGPIPNTTEAQLIETSPGTLMLNMRDNRGSFRSIATTADLGKTWTEHHTSYQALQDPVCMASFIKANVLVKGKQQQVVFFGNDNTQNGRFNLTIKASTDLGESWDSKNELLVDDRKLFGYSSLTKIDDGMIGFFYEGVRDMYFVRIPVTEILK
ncbi:sialidase family protein [Pedobacter insulae]|uniref:exo-alpha-sialidase n=1 Tax=Pedobacter insulae TaxID=414048 RepID=A0A1I2WHH0_9SPHI|nr:sialidase family protein [Pedobacter insulae]SFH00714.1 sialidase-1 [Pedobacter insulae]